MRHPGGRFAARALAAECGGPSMARLSRLLLLVVVVFVALPQCECRRHRYGTLNNARARAQQNPRRTSWRDDDDFEESHELFRDDVNVEEVTRAARKKIRRDRNKDVRQRCAEHWSRSFT